MPHITPDAAAQPGVDRASQIEPMILLEDDLLRMIGLSQTTVWRLERARKFPRRLRLNSRRVAWLRSEVLDWIAARAAERR